MPLVSYHQMIFGSCSASEVDILVTLGDDLSMSLGERLLSLSS